MAEERNFALLVANPELQRALVKVKPPLHFEFFGRIGRGPDFDANLRGHRATEFVL